MRLGIIGILLVSFFTSALVFADGDWLPKSPDKLEKVKRIVTKNVKDLAEKNNCLPVSLVDAYVAGLMKSLDRNKGEGMIICLDGKEDARFTYTQDDNGNIRSLKLVRYRKDFGELFSRFKIYQNKWGDLIQQFNSLGYASTSVPDGTFKLSYNFEKGNFESTINAGYDLEKRNPSASNDAVKPNGNISKRPVENSVDVQGFSAALTTTIEAATHEWKQRYICGRAITVRPFKGESKETGKVKETVEETAGPGYIKLDPDTRFSVRNIILHAMTHACQPEKPTMLSEPIPFPDGWIIGYQGASIMVRLRNGNQTYFRKMEEGMCERNASFFPGYSVPNLQYLSVGKLARQHFPQEQDTMRYVRHNDVPGIVAVILNETEISPGDIDKVIRMYQKAWDAGGQNK